jgi:transposase
MKKHTKKTEYVSESVDLKDTKIAELEAKVEELSKLVEHFKELFLLSQANRFGKSSEKLEVLVDTQQLSLFDEAESVADPVFAEPELEEVLAYKRRKQKGKREQDLEGLPVETVDCTFDSEQICPECGGAMHVCGHEIVRKELVVTPPQFKVREYRNEVVSCRHCEKNADSEHPTPMLKSSVPNPVIKGGYASPELLAHIAAQKYVNAVPLYRQETDFLRNDINLSRQTMSNWIIKGADVLFPLYGALQIYQHKETILNLDETPFEVLREPGKKAQTVSYMWVYATGKYAEHKIVLFDYKDSRKHENPKIFLGDFEGFIHSDGFQAYHNLSPLIVVVGCWTHARRKFADILKTLKAEFRKNSKAYIAMQYFKQLAKLEVDYENLSPEERCTRRLTESKPVAEALFAWAETINAEATSGLGKALSYLANQRKWLMNVYLDGRLEMTNNRAERSIRPFVIGRKNWLFCNTPGGANASAIMYSIVETAKENELKPYEYLKYLFEKLPNIPASEIDTLFPWSPELPEHIRNATPVLTRAGKRRKSADNW